MFFCRFPFGKDVFTVDNTQNTNDLVVSFFDFEGNIASLLNGKLCILENKSKFKNLKTNQLLYKKFDNTQFENQTTYEEKILLVKDFLNKNKLPKLVLSRIKPVLYDDFFGSIDFSASFENLCIAYPNAFVYILKQENTIWMGAFSELLGRFHKKTNSFETMSLAGTILLENKWSSKELNEQKTVSDYIENILKSFSNIIENSETYDHVSGYIKHLRTDFRTEIRPDELDNLIAQLHPTPAVCGFPKVLCKSAIHDFENHTRELYAGYIRVETEEMIEYFVNLRCGKFYQNGAEVFVGGGINSESIPEKEWQETELKSLALIGNLKWK